jgi:hypothetical protein
MKALDSERAALLRDVRLKEEMEALYAKRGTLQVLKTLQMSMQSRHGGSHACAALLQFCC